MSRLLSVTEPSGTTTAYTYDALGRRISTSDGSLKTEYRYDAVGNLTRQSNELVDLAYRYDLNGRMTEESRTEGEATVRTGYTYDKAGQLTASRRSDGYSESFIYDPVGNMVEKTLNGTRIAMTYDAANELKTMESPHGKLTYAYDLNGNLTQKTLGDRTDTYSYDARNHLKQYRGYDNYEVKYSYNALGMLHARESSGNHSRTTLEELIAGKEDSDDPDGDGDGPRTTTYVYDLTQPYYEVLTETTDSEVTSYTYGLERLAAYTEQTQTRYLYDGRGSVIQTLGSLGTETMAYSAYGELLTEKTSGYGYNGEYYDAATGMLNLRARQYEPAQARFSQRDVEKGSVTVPLQLNRYSFVINDPISYTDPSGKFILTALIIGAAAGFITGATIGATKNYNKQKAEQAQDPAKKINGWKIAGHAVVYGVIGGLTGGAAGTAAVGLTAAVGATSLTAAGVGVTTTAVQSAGIAGVVSVGAGATNRYLATVADNIMDKPSVPKKPVKEALNPKAVSIDAVAGMTMGTASNLINHGFTLTKSMGSIGKTGSLPEGAFEESPTMPQRNYTYAQANGGTLPQKAQISACNSKSQLSGEWQKTNEAMSYYSRNYQTQITGREGESFVQNGVKFDGMSNGVLIEAKGSYSQFVNPSTGEFKPWFTGADGLIAQASGQIRASEGARIQWYFADQQSLRAVQILFQREGISGIEFIYQPIN